MAIFMPAQPIREVNPSPTPSWPRSPLTSSGALPPLQKPAPLLANGATTEEVKIVQPVSLRQGRGARLSFLGSRKKDQAPAPPVPQINGDHPTEEESNLSRSRSVSKDNPNRRSFFRAHAPSESTRSNGTEMSPAVPGGPRPDVSGVDWVSDLAPRESGDPNALDKEKSQSDHSGGMLHVGNVRKRLSILRLGKKSSRGNGGMGSLDEE